MKVTLPRTCFVSYSYDEAGALSSLRHALKNHATALRSFPFLEPDPAHPVSDGIIPKILACDGLIYIGEGEASHSKWVFFERDYARRAGRPVFRFDPSSQAFFPDDRPPVRLDIQAMTGAPSLENVKRLFRWMKEQRHFQIEHLRTVHRMKEIPELELQIRQERRIVLWVLDADTAGILDVIHGQVDDKVLWDFFEGNPQCDSLPPPVPSMRIRVSPGWTPPSFKDAEVRAVASEYLASMHFLDLVGADGDINWNRADDLIVGLTMESFRYEEELARQREEEEEEE